MITRVSIGFDRFADTKLDGFARAVIDSMTGNAAYPSPPVALADLQTARDDFTAKLSAAQMGGPADTAAKNNSRKALIEKLRRVAGYVQINCNDDLARLLSSGFEAHSRNRAQTALEQPSNLVIKNGTSGQLVASVARVKNVGLYEGRIKASEGDWLPSVFTRDSRHITFLGLIPGEVYTIEVRVLGGSTGQSDWSDPSSHRSM